MHLRPLLIGAALVLGLSAPVATGATAPARAGGSPATTPLHFLTNLDGAVRAPRGVGYNVFGVGASRSQVDALPSGVKALVWLGQKCPTTADAAFRREVDALADHPKVLGWYLSDEPHVADCPGGPRALHSRAAYVHRASAGRQRAFVTLTEGDYYAFRPRVTGVDLVGVVAYPCTTKGCDWSRITTKVRRARHAGVALRRIVPVYQAFGQQRASYHYYHQPSVDQTRRLLRTWAAAVPDPVMDYTYGWGNQSSANPTLVDTTALQDTYRWWFQG